MYAKQKREGLTAPPLYHRLLFPVELSAAHVCGLRAFGALLDFKDHFLSFAQGLEAVHVDGGKVHKNIGSARLFEESKALLFVEPLNAAFTSATIASLPCYLPVLQPGTDLRPGDQKLKIIMLQLGPGFHTIFEKIGRLWDGF